MLEVRLYLADLQVLPEVTLELELISLMLLAAQHWETAAAADMERPVVELLEAVLLAVDLPVELAADQAKPVLLDLVLAVGEQGEPSFQDIPEWEAQELVGSLPTVNQVATQAQAAAVVVEIREIILLAAAVQVLEPRSKYSVLLQVR
jgi:hypothetical protein